MKTQTSRTFILALALIAFSNPLFSQEQPTGRSILNGGTGFTSFEFRQIGLKDLNLLLQQNGYGTFATTQFTWGGGGFFSVHNILIGGEGHSFLTSSVQSVSNSAKLQAGYGFLNAGYLLHNTSRSIFYVVGGIGGGGCQLTIASKNAQPDLNQQLASPSGNYGLNSGGLLFNTQLGYRLFLSKELAGWAIGLNAGYTFSPNAWAFRNEQGTVNGTPGISLNGLYFGLTFGGGGFERTKNK